MNPTNMRCPDCGSGRRSDGYHREGWYWLECDRRYNPDTDEYSPENNRCRLTQLEAKFEELHTACLEYLKAPPANVPARRKFAEIVTGGSCDHLDDDIVTEQHECDWEFVVPYYKGAEKVFIVCRHTHCKMVLTKKMAVDMLNEYEPLKKENEALKAWMDVREYPDRITEDDEIWANSVSVHIERMSNGHIWMRIGEHTFDLYSRWGKLSWIPQAGSWDALLTKEHLDD